ncbi:amidase [Amycolatopsis jejuensis]|uniref:amidase n=1 Tax=Amycolatopsis jejuensis TaxID=330084 RepID=UPI0006909AC6|nr:amidase family protein [Amycolatopsis jejuensis]
MTAELWQLSAVEQARLVARQDVSPTELVTAALHRIEAVDPVIHAFTEVDADAALAEARRQEGLLAAGTGPGPMAGVPIAVKDLLFTRGLRTTGGSKPYRDFLPGEDDVVVERVRAAGAIVVGKTNVSEFGFTALSDNPLHPTTRNPWNPDLTPGGSSAGSAAAVAAGASPFALGSDGGGSVRAPAAHCGIVGFKPSMGRVPLYPGCRDERYPGFSGWESIEHIGPLARSVEDAAFLMSVIAGPDPRDRHSIPCDDVRWTSAPEYRTTGPRIAYCPDFGYVAVDPEVRAIAGKAARTLADALGATFEETSPGWADPFEAFWGTVALDTDLTGLRGLDASALGPDVHDVIGRSWTAEQLTDAIVGRKAFANAMARFMRDWEFLVTPTLTVPPFPLDVRGPEVVDGVAVSQFAWTSFTLPFNLTGQPAISVPAGRTSDGRPVGLQIAGRHLADASVLGAAAAFQDAADWRGSWPLTGH